MVYSCCLHTPGRRLSECWLRALSKRTGSDKTFTYKVSQNEVLIKIVNFNYNHLVSVYTTNSQDLVPMHIYIYTSYAHTNWHTHYSFISHILTHMCSARHILTHPYSTSCIQTHLSESRLPVSEESPSGTWTKGNHPTIP